MEIDNSTYLVYSPTSVLGIFNNALRLPATVNLILLKGRYSFGANKAYGNYYYDLLYSESDSVSIGVKISSLLRSKIQNNEVYTLKGFIEKNVKNSSIQLLFVVDEVVSQEAKKISEEDLQRFELVQEKLTAGSKDLENLIRTKILNNESIKIANIYGHNAIVQRDFAEGLDISKNHFEITDFTCNITSATSIQTQLKELENLNFDIIALVRGGGDRQSFDAFNDVALAKLFIALQPLTVTAIGHTVDETLVDKLSDRRFHLPHDYGSGLHKIIEKLREEKSNSRAVLIEEVKKDVTKQFEEQVKTLTTQLGNKNREFTKLQVDSAKQIKDLTENTQKQLKAQSDEMAKYKTDIADLHAKNLKSAIQSETATLNARIESVSKENVRLQEELSKKKSSMLFYVVLLVIGIIIGFILTKL